MSGILTFFKISVPMYLLLLEGLTMKAKRRVRKCRVETNVYCDKSVYKHGLLIIQVSLVLVRLFAIHCDDSIPLIVVVHFS
jgi:hypothetical protein